MIKLRLLQIIDKSEEFLLIKYSDGGIISTDTGALDLIAFFAPSGTEGVVVDSLSKKGSWTRKKLSAKKRAVESIWGASDHIKRGVFNKKSIEMISFLF